MSGPDALGHRIRLLRAARGLTQRALAEPRYTAAYVSAVESGRRVPSGDALAHFAERLGSTLMELTTGRSPAESVRLDVRLAVADAAAHDDAAAARPLYQEILTAAAPLGAAVTAGRGHLGLAQLSLRHGDAAAAAGHAAHAEELLTDAAPHVRAEVTAVQSALLRHRGDVRYAVYLLSTTRDDLIRDGYPDPALLLRLHAELAVCHHELGDEEAAAVDAADALTLTRHADPVRVAKMHLTLAHSLLAADRLAEAGIAAEQARQAAGQAALKMQLACCHRARGRGRWTAGDVAGALDDLRTGHAGFRAAGYAEAAADVAVELAEVHRAAGRPDQAITLLAEAVTGGAQPPARAARVARLRGQLAADAGDRLATERHLRQAVAGYRESGPQRELATTVLLLAGLLQEWDRPDDAVDVLHDGLRTVELLGEPEPLLGRTIT